VRGTGITDSALIHLKRAKNLQSLMLDHTKVTDAGLHYLRDLKDLRSLDLSQTAVSAEGIAKTKASFPQASVKP
jgi:internalin A